MINKKSIIIIKNQQNDILYQKNRSNLNITFNRIAFIFFMFLIICLIYSIHLVHLGSRNTKTKELKENPPSRSAKLRYVIKKDDFYDFKTDILKKFEYLINIENFGNKL